MRKKKDCWKNFEWCEKSWQLTWRRRSGALTFLHLRFSFPVSHVLFSFCALPYFVTFCIFSFNVELLVHPHSSDALFSSPTRLYAYWRVLSRLSSGGNYIIRVWAKWLSRVSIGGVNWAWRLTLDGEGCSASRTWTDVDVGQSKKNESRRDFH